jgi:predicted nucleic acid binding AN1-type Zn finger protein
MAEQLCFKCSLFFGSQEGLCSKCFRTVQASKTADIAVSSLINLIEESKENPKPVQSDKDRCFTCSRRVGPVKFPCRCEYTFCTKHRLPEEHACTFDHAQAGRRKLTEDNPLVIAEKVAKI